MAELSRLDKIEFNIEEPPKLNEKVIENKRKKLKETWYRILSLYKKDDMPKYDQLKRIEMEYDAKRVQLIKKYEAVNSTKQVNLEEIPLPFCPDNTQSSSNDQTKHQSDITFNLTKSNLREPQSQYLTITGELRDDLRPPGCPSIVPPSIEELEEDARIAKESKNAEKDLDEFLKEVDQVEKMATKDQIVTNKELHTDTLNKSILPPTNIPPPMALLANLSSASLPKSINQPPFPTILLNPQLSNPMGLNHLAKKSSNMQRQPNPHLINKFNPSLANKQPNLYSKKEPEKISTSSTIEAKPQLRNLSADVCKFLPTSLRIKRQETKKPVPKSNKITQLHRQPIITSNHTSNHTITNRPNDNQANKDTAYEEFMKELNGLI